MSTTLGTVLTDVRNRLNESSARFWQDAELTALINEAGRVLAVDTLCLQAEQTYPTVAYQPNYALPNNFISALSVQYQEKYDLTALKDYDEHREMRGTTEQSTGTPYYYWIQPDAEASAALGWLMIDPVPTSGGAETTLDGDITASSSTINVASASDFENQGTFILDSEVVRFRYKSTNALSVLTRGSENTAATSHSSGVAVYLRDLRMRYNCTPEALSTTSSYLQIPDKWLDAMKDWVIAHSFYKDSNYPSGDRYMQVYNARMAEVVRGARRQTPERINTIRNFRFRGRNPLFRR